MEKSLKDLLIDELYSLLNAEEQIMKALPDMIGAAESPDLKKGFDTHLKETKGQIQRLEKILQLLHIEKKEKFCNGIKSLIQECKDAIKDFKTHSPLRDAAIISKAQRIEHYEIAAYGTLYSFAQELELDEVAALLQATLEEEGAADQNLSKIAEGGLLKPGINQQAAQSKGANSKDLNKNSSGAKKTKR